MFPGRGQNKEWIIHLNMSDICQRKFTLWFWCCFFISVLFLWYLYSFGVAACVVIFHNTQQKCVTNKVNYPKIRKALLCWHICSRSLQNRFKSNLMNTNKVLSAWVLIIYAYSQLKKKSVKYQIFMTYHLYIA